MSLLAMIEGQRPLVFSPTAKSKNFSPKVGSKLLKKPSGILFVDEGRVLEERNGNGAKLTRKQRQKLKKKRPKQNKG